MMEKQEAYHLVLHRGKPHGFKGVMKFQIAANLNDAFSNIEHLYVNSKGTYIPYFVEELSFPNEKYCIVKLEDIDSDSIKVSDLFISDTELELYTDNEEENDIYVGYNCEDIELGPLGKIIRIEQMPSQDLAIIIYHQKEIMIPLVEGLIESIDDENQKIVFKLPDGYLEIYN